MSTPIIACQVYKAALGDEDMFSQLVEAMKYNLRWGVWSHFACECDPPCPRPSEKQSEKFNDRMNAALGRPQVKDNHESDDRMKHLDDQEPL